MIFTRDLHNNFSMPFPAVKVNIDSDAGGLEQKNGAPKQSSVSNICLTHETVRSSIKK